MKAYDLVLIVGPKHNITTLKAAYAKSGKAYLIIGDGINPVTREQITALDGTLSPNARIDIWAHGSAAQGVHALDLMDPKKTPKATFLLLDFLKPALSHRQPTGDLRQFAQVHLWSCYAGAAKHECGRLPEETVLITHASHTLPSYVHMNAEGIEAGITRYQHSSNPFVDFAHSITHSPETATLSTKLGGIAIEHTARASAKPLSHDLACDLKSRVLADYTSALAPLKTHTGHAEVTGGITQLADAPALQVLAKYRDDASIIKQNLINANYIRDFLAISAPRDDLLHYAIRHGSPAIAAIILADPRSNPNGSSIDGTTPLHDTVTYNQEPTLKALVTDPRTQIERTDIHGNTALHLAAKTPQRAHLIPELATRISLELTNLEHQTALHLAARFGGPENINAMLKHICAESVTDKDGAHPLHLAAAHAGPDSVAALLPDIWTDVNARDKRDRAPLHYAAIHDKPANIDALMNDSKCAINAQDNNGNTALHFAIAKRHLDSVAALLKRGASTAIPNKTGNTPLSLAQSQMPDPQVKRLPEEIAASSETTKKLSTIIAMLTPAQINKDNPALTHTSLEKEAGATIFSVHFKSPQKRDHFLCANAPLLSAIKNGAENREMFTASDKDLYIHDHGTSTHFVEFRWSKTIHPHLASTLDRFVEAAQKIVPHPPVPERTKQLPKRRIATIEPPATELPRPLPSFAERMQQASQRQQAIAAR